MRKRTPSRDRRRATEAPPERVARPTLRCLETDLRIPLPPRTVDLGALDHPILAKARQLAPSYPKNQKRIEEITDTLVYRFTYGRNRVADWEDIEDGSIWVCASELRREGASHDAYDYFIDLHTDGDLLPGDDDRLRYEAEAAQRLLAAIRAGVPKLVSDALAHEGGEQALVLPGGATVYLLFRRSSGTDDFWLAMPTLNAPTGGLTQTSRDVVAALVEQTIGGETLWDDVYEWPTRPLQGYEIAMFGVRQS